MKRYKSLLHRKPLPMHVQASKALELMQPPPPSLRAQCCQSQARPLPPPRPAPALPDIRDLLEGEEDSETAGSDACAWAPSDHRASGAGRGEK
ncbi:hypothetical protein NGA_0174200, partial [Nannochloropsis gaditana CCMP526]|uniref:uncharacterized protein n=1 Tax=Nannochloropsis gaditana (strain CCMP526) TaxID=1093141 RepID=UPI00029F6A6F